MADKELGFKAWDEANPGVAGEALRPEFGLLPGLLNALPCENGLLLYVIPTGQIIWLPGATLSDSPPTIAERPAYWVNTDTVRLRERPSTDAPILQELATGTHVTGTGARGSGNGHDWLEVTLDDGTLGWVAADYLSETEPPDDGGLTDESDHRFSFEELWPTIQAAGTEFGFDPQVLAGILRQESGFKNWRVHFDGTGHGLGGLDDNGMLPDFEQWSGIDVGRGQDAISIPIVPQIRYMAMALSRYAQRYGDAYAAARAWHRGPNLMNDSRGQNYEQLIRQHITELFG